jgi:hypothetical protein
MEGHTLSRIVLVALAVAAAWLMSTSYASAQRYRDREDDFACRPVGGYPGLFPTRRSDGRTFGSAGLGGRGGDSCDIAVSNIDRRWNLICTGANPGYAIVRYNDATGVGGAFPSLRECVDAVRNVTDDGRICLPEGSNAPGYQIRNLRDLGVESRDFRSFEQCVRRLAGYSGSGRGGLESVGPIFRERGDTRERVRGFGELTCVQVPGYSGLFPARAADGQHFGGAGFVGRGDGNCEEAIENANQRYNIVCVNDGRGVSLMNYGNGQTFGGRFSDLRACNRAVRTVNNRGEMCAPDGSGRGGYQIRDLRDLSADDRYYGSLEQCTRRLGN